MNLVTHQSATLHRTTNVTNNIRRTPEEVKAFLERVYAQVYASEDMERKNRRRLLNSSTRDDEVVQELPRKTEVSSNQIGGNPQGHIKGHHQGRIKEEEHTKNITVLPRHRPARTKKLR
jgi:hypothetical protein